MTARWNVQFFKFIGVVSIVTLTLMAAVAESSAQTSKNITDDYYVCLDALNRERTAWDTNDPKFAKDVAEAIRRGLTVDRCRQMMPTRNPPANTQSQNKPPSIIANHTDENLCMTALNRERSAWDQNPNYSEYVAEARRRGLTVDRCRQMMPTRDLTKNLPASTDSGSISGWFLILVASAIIFLGWMFVRGVTPSVPAQGQDSWLRADAQEWSLGGDEYPNTARMIDVIAFLVLASGGFVPIARLGFRMMHLVDTDVALIFAGAALAGLAAAFARYRRIAVTSAVVYGALFAFFVVHIHQTLATMRANLKDNLFGGLAEAFVGLEWGCAVITFAVLTVLCSNVFVRRIYQP